MQAFTAEVRVVLEAPTEVDEGMYKYSPNSIILLNFICGFCFTLDVISIYTCTCIAQLLYLEIYDYTYIQVVVSYKVLFFVLLL